MLIAVLQMDDNEALNAAKEHLESNGFKAEVGPFSNLDKSEYLDWMTPESGGYIFYLEKEKYQPAMEMLGNFFGYEG